MFNVNDTVMYGNNGVYKIKDIRLEAFGNKEKTMYYVLTHIENDSLTVFCPVENSKIPLHRLLSVEEIYDLIKTMPNTESEWIENDQKRTAKFTQILKTGSRRDLIKLIKTLYFKREEKIKEGKKLHVADERLMKEAEKVLHEEFAHVLQMSPEEVLPFITSEINKLTK